MVQEIKNRIEALRQEMKRRSLDAFVIPSTDPHMSEYVADHWKVREWISGFNGSAGTVLVTQEMAGLWTDSRYFIQAEEQLKDTGIKLYKDMLPETPTMTEILCRELPAGSTVAIDGQMFSVAQYEGLRSDLVGYDINVQCVNDIIDAIWTDRPASPTTPPYIYDLKYAGKSAADKLEAICQGLTNRGTFSILVSSLDEIAWTLNLRGSDIECNPVFIGYLYISHMEKALFIDPAKVTKEVEDYLKSIDVMIMDYNHVTDFLQDVLSSSIIIQPEKMNCAIYQAINPECEIQFADSPIPLAKSIRNETEIAGIHQAMIRDGVAMTRFLHWLEGAVAQGNETELSITDKLQSFRAMGNLYKGESFGTIAGYGPHGAIVHYSATPESNAKLEPHGFLLLDSGAQYLDGTTDITRTIALGELTDEEKEDYTLVLKGHIALAMARFPEGTRGAQLDALARMPMWQKGMNYLHGTGHGIGHFLNVHEGPQSIRMNENPVTLHLGMVTSNEPGVYKAGKHGIRIENLILTIPTGEGMYGQYYAFETLTLCPICTKGILVDWLSKEEREWLNNYHRNVFALLESSLDEADKEWLRLATKEI